jgi:hypothetical protein
VSKLRERLLDASRSGVYRTSGIDALDDAVRGTRLNYARVNLPAAASKDAILEATAAALAFPGWFGRNWDALEDCLTDLSWQDAAGHVVVFAGVEPSDEAGILIDVLASAAAFWASRGKPFFAVLLDPARSLPVADLYRER